MIDIINFLIQNWSSILLTMLIMFMVMVLYAIFNVDNEAVLTGDPTDNPKKVNKNILYGNEVNSTKQVHQVQVEGFENAAVSENAKPYMCHGKHRVDYRDKECNKLHIDTCRQNEKYQGCCVLTYSKNNKAKCVAASKSGRPAHHDPNIDYWCGKNGEVFCEGIDRIKEYQKDPVKIQLCKPK